MKVLDKQKAFFLTGKTLPIEFRRNALESLQKQLLLHEQDLLSALYKDLGKSEFEGFETELGMVYGELKETLRHLKKWMKPKQVATPRNAFSLQRKDCTTSSGSCFGDCSMELSDTTVFNPFNWCNCCWKLCDTEMLRVCTT